MKFVMLFLVLFCTVLWADLEPDADVTTRDEAEISVEGILEVLNKTIEKTSYGRTEHITAVIDVKKTLKGQDLKKIKVAWTYYPDSCPSNINSDRYKGIVAKWHLYKSKNTAQTATYTLVNIYCVEEIEASDPENNEEINN